MAIITKAGQCADIKRQFLVIIKCLLSILSYSQSTGSNPLDINGYSLWMTGRDSATIQLIPRTGKNGLMMEGGKTVVHARFKVNSYGEISIPISASSAPNAEAHSVNLSGSRFVKIKYKANQTVILQLRQTGVHGGIHNHVLLPPSDEFISSTIYFSSFEGGLQPLNLKDVAKFNFAFLDNNKSDGFADLVIQSFVIDRYKP
jgi:hypothetical protein